LQGLIMSSLDRLPVVGDTIAIEPHRYTVKKMKKNEIISVVVEYMPYPNTGSDPEISE